MRPPPTRSSQSFAPFAMRTRPGFDYDVRAIFKDIQARQAASGRTYVRYPGRRVAEERDDPSAR